jgi:hypothetical protein
VSPPLEPVPGAAQPNQMYEKCWMGVRTTVLQPKSQELQHKHISDSRSFMRISARSSEKFLAAWMTRTLNISTGSNGGRPPPVRSV